MLAERSNFVKSILIKINFPKFYTGLDSIEADPCHQDGRRDICNVTITQNPLHRFR